MRMRPWIGGTPLAASKSGRGVAERRAGTQTRARKGGEDPEHRRREGNSDETEPPSQATRKGRANTDLTFSVIRAHSHITAWTSASLKYITRCCSCNFPHADGRADRLTKRLAHQLSEQLKYHFAAASCASLLGSAKVSPNAAALVRSFGPTVPLRIESCSRRAAALVRGAPPVLPVLRDCLAAPTHAAQGLRRSGLHRHTTGDRRKPTATGSATEAWPGRRAAVRGAELSAASLTVACSAEEIDHNAGECGMAPRLLPLCCSAHLCAALSADHSQRTRIRPPIPDPDATAFPVIAAAMIPRILALALVAVSSLLPCASARIVETLTFADVKAAGQERLTLFHFSSDPKSGELVLMLEEAATQLQALRLPALERFSFAEVDCVKPPNAGECSAAGFTAGKDWLFTSTQASGIQAYTGPRTASAVATHVHHKFLPADPSLVQTWKDEESFFRSLDSPRAKPVFLKLWEEWCTHCKALKHPFEQMAVYFAPQVTFMELECSRSEISKAFCARHGATSFPTLMLFDGEDLKQKYDGERTIVGVEEFFLSKLTESQFKQIGGAKTDAAAKKTKTKQSKPAKDNKSEETESTGASAATKSAAKSDDSATSAKSVKSKKAAAPAEEDESDDEEEEEEAPKKRKQKKSAQKKNKKKSAKKQPKKKTKKTRQQIEDEEDEQPIEDEDDDDDDDAAPVRNAKKASGKKKKQQKKKKAQRKQRDEDQEDDAEEAQDEDEDEAPKKKQKKKAKKPAQKKKQKKKRAPVEEEEEEEEDEEPAPPKKTKKQSKQTKQKKAATSTAGMTQAERRKAKRAAKAAADAADQHLHDEL